MQAKSIICFLFILCWICLPIQAHATTDSKPMDPIVRKQLEKLGTGEMESFWQRFHKDYEKHLSSEVPDDLIDFILSAKKQMGMKEILQAFGRYFFHEILYNSKLLGMIIVLTVLSMLLQTLQSAFENKQVSRVAYAIVFMVILVLAVQSFSIAVEAATTAIGRMIDFMLAMMPLLLTLLASMGSVTSVTLFHPLIVFMIHIVGLLIHLIVMPLLFFSTVLNIVSSISDKYKVNRLANLLRNVSIALLGGLLTIFLGVITVQGASASVTDGFAIRTAKYITGNFVPIVGRTISDAADTVLGASLLVKNTIGLAGVLMLLLICAFPALKILSLAFIYNFSAAILQPMGNSPIIESLHTIGNTLIYVFAALATVGLMFFLAITIIVTSGNIAVMMR